MFATEDKLRLLAPQRYLDAAADIQRQSRKARCGIVMLAGQVFDGGIELEVSAEPITAAGVDLLIGGSKVVVGQEHAGTEERVDQKCAAVTASHKVSAQR